MIIDCGFGVIRVEMDMDGSGAQMCLMTPSVAGDDHYNAPAESAELHVTYEAAQALIAELSKIVKPVAGKARLVKGLQ